MTPKRPPERKRGHHFPPPLSNPSKTTFLPQPRRATIPPSVVYALRNVRRSSFLPTCIYGPLSDVVITSQRVPLTSVLLVELSRPRGGCPPNPRSPSLRYALGTSFLTRTVAQQTLDRVRRTGSPRPGAPEASSPFHQGGGATPSPWPERTSTPSTHSVSVSSTISQRSGLGPLLIRAVTQL